MIEQKIIELKKEILNYSNFIKQMIIKAADSFLKDDIRLGKEVIEVDEKKANEEENKLEEECIKTIALYQPEAKELRFVIMINKMASDIERIGDKAVNIAESSIKLSGKPKLKSNYDIQKMTEITIKMLEDSIFAFVNENIEISYELLKKDDEVDAMRDQIYNEIISYMAKNPESIDYCLHILRIARNLEKIADITSNICEDNIYISQGKMIKHHY